MLKEVAPLAVIMLAVGLELPRLGIKVNGLEVMVTSPLVTLTSYSWALTPVVGTS